VPINAHLSCRVQWLAGYIDSNGIHQSNSHELEIGIEQDMLLNVDDIRYMLLGMGVRCTIRHDYKGFKHLLTISANDIVKLNELGIVTRHISLREFKKVLHEPHITVTSIVLTEHAPTVTYCFTESINHSGVFNGILTGQSEVILPTDDERTAVCCLASPNIEKYDEWQHDKLFIHDTAEMLDNCLAIFKRDAPDTLRRAKYSVECENSIGIGALGWHAFLQSKSIPFESEDARKWNVKIFCDLKRRVDEANYALGLERGSPHDAVGTGRRFCSTMAIAPNATTSIIMGNTSPGIEPYRANAYRQDTLSGSNLNKNRHLDALLKSKQHLNVDETWMSILMHDGSVQHLECLTNHEKAVFKTAFEIDQNVIIRLAADRQRFIDQSQSLNIFLRPDVPVKLLHSLHMDAWRFGLKTLYYCRSTKISTADKLSSKQTTMCTRRKPGDSTECHACE
jgi:ribonucleoside-diphosphate reductase alpha chain